METPGGASRNDKDQGLYNKPSAAVHPGVLAAGTLLQYNTIHVDEELINELRYKTRRVCIVIHVSRRPRTAIWAPVKTESRLVV